LPGNVVLFQNMSSSSLKNTLKDCSLLLLIGAIVYLPFLGIPVWDGNEPVRVIVAKEMLKTGNWIMPMLHGKPYFAKPPLMNWLIAASGGLFGVMNEWTGRLPSVIMMLLTGMSLYFLTKKWLGREGRLFAAIMILCMAGLIRAGREAEIDSLQTFIIPFILLAWINGYIRQWKPAFVWGITLSLAGIGFLSKGPQVIIFFYVTIISYLLLRKRTSYFFSKAHLFGAGLFILVLALYVSLILRWTTFDSYVKMWIGEGMQRTESGHLLSYLKHIVLYPIELMLSFIPCSLFLVPLIIYRDVRQEVKKAFSNEILMFSLIAVAANFPLYWLLPNMRNRYFFPAYPFVTLVTAVIFEIYISKMHAFPAISVFFRKFLKVFAMLTIFLAVAAVPAGVLLHLKLSFLLFLLIACIIFSGTVVLYKSSSIRLTHIPIYTVLITALFFLIYTDFSIRLEEKQGTSTREIAREINLILPRDVDTVYELGYRRALRITCYIDREVRQVDSFAELKALDTGSGNIYFIYDSEFMDVISDKDKKTFLKDMHSETVYSKKFRSRHRGEGDIVVGKIS
jgi:4-amino-4-deoxy-L-arabinose transferase-like glycosyltransferase